jgi:hypothetical protein
MQNYKPHLSHVIQIANMFSAKGVYPIPNTDLISTTLKPSAQNSDDTAQGIAQGLDRPIASMDRVLTPLTRCAVHERASRTAATQIALNVLERRAVLSGEVVPHTAVMAVRGVFDLVDP